MTNTRTRKWKRVAAWIATSLTTGLAILMMVTVGWRPLLGARSRPLTDQYFERTAERMARGKYLVEGVLGCMDCHSQLNGEIQPGVAPVFTHKGGGRIMIHQTGFVLAAPNITPDVETGAGSDGRSTGARDSRRHRA